MCLKEEFCSTCSVRFRYFLQKFGEVTETKSYKVRVLATKAVVETKTLATYDDARRSNSTHVPCVAPTYFTNQSAIRVLAGIIANRVFSLSSFTHHSYSRTPFWVLYYCSSIKRSGDLKVSSRGKRFGIFFTTKKNAKFDWEPECQRVFRFILNGILVLMPSTGATCDLSRLGLRTQTLVY